MKTDLDGYLICYNSNLKQPLGVVAMGYECKVTTSYVPSRIKEFLIHIEDKRFYNHIGFDIKSFVRATVKNLESLRVVQGGSTITQQLARNILKDNKRSFTRKAKELFKAIQLEIKYSKEEILMLYFNNVYWGKNIYGIRAAGLHYFGKDVTELTQIDFLFLLTLLRGPNFYLKNRSKVTARFELINKLLYTNHIISKGRYAKNIKAKFILNENRLNLVRPEVIPYIAQNIDHKTYKIVSTLDKLTQGFVQQIVSDSKFPTSVIALQNNRVIAFASSYGTEYPFIHRSNVGSTLKPFLYCYLRESGISRTEKFNAYHNTLGWVVKEASYFNSNLTIAEALFYSNNNAFINACDYVGMNNCLEFLSGCLGMERKKFFPSSLLGASLDGISLYELALAYSQFFNSTTISDSKRECLEILNQIAKHKLGFQITNGFLKTGTTNGNTERFAVLGDSEITFAILRNGQGVEDESKDDGLIAQISKQFASFFKTKRSYAWS